MKKGGRKGGKKGGKEEGGEKGRKKKERKIQNFAMELLHPHCNDSKYNTGLPGLL